MSLAMNTECILCHINKNIATARKLGDEATATAFARELMQLHLQLPADANSAMLGPATNALFTKYYGLSQDRYRVEKENANRFVLERLDEIRQRVESAADPLLAGLQFSILGNYLDFSALQGQISFQELEQMMDQALEMKLDPVCYAAFCQELEKSKTLLYITDNAGEIGFDRIFGEVLARHYPHLAITFCARGKIAQNDATREDAALMGIPFPVIDNGNDVAGTEFTLLSREAREAIAAADVILAKGMGNTETMLGCGYNVYYAFLVKCARFASYFQAPMMQPLFLREKDQPKPKL